MLLSVMVNVIVHHILPWKTFYFITLTAEPNPEFE